jgi:hypothetical protein
MGHSPTAASVHVSGRALDLAELAGDRRRPVRRRSADPADPGTRRGPARVPLFGSAGDAMTTVDPTQVRPSADTDRHVDPPTADEMRSACAVASKTATTSHSATSIARHGVAGFHVIALVAAVPAFTALLLNSTGDTRTRFALGVGLKGIDNGQPRRRLSTDRRRACRGRWRGVPAAIVASRNRSTRCFSAPLAGIEPATHGLGNRCSIH